MTASNPSKMKPALIGGASLAVASSVPILNLANLCCCALVIGGGVLAAYVYMKDAEPSAKAPLGDGVLLGALTGVFGAVIATLISIPVTLLFSSLGAGDAISQALEQVDLPPAVLGIIETFAGGGFALGAIVIRFFFSLVLYVIFAGIGALIGVAIFNKKPPETA